MTHSSNMVQKIGAAVLTLSLLVAFYSRRSTDQSFIIRSVLDGLLRAERNISVRPLPRVAVGFGSCLDGVVDGVRLLRSLRVKPPRAGKYHGAVRTEQEFVEMFAYFFEAGAAAERYINNRPLFSQLVLAARALPSTQWSVGGNAAVMANRFALEGCDVLLGTKLTKETAERIHPLVTLAGNESSFTDTDDIHLCFEYKMAKSWGRYLSPRANRFIVHKDMFNPYLSSLENFANDLVKFSPSLIVIGGLQMMDGFPFKTGERTALLKKVRDLLEQQPMDVMIHFEMASFTGNALLRELTEYVLPYVDSVGMNEQELPNLKSILGHRTVTVVSESVPRVASTLDDMRGLYDILQTYQLPPEVHNGRRVSRLHVHTLAFQAILTRRSSLWKNTRSAAAKASLTANRHVCNSHLVDLEKSHLILDSSFSLSLKPGSARVFMEEDHPVSCWTEDNTKFCIAPGLMCTKVHKTAGGGDNISSAALAIQV